MSERASRSSARHHWHAGLFAVTFALPHKAVATNWQTAFNMLNNYLGTGLLSLPYCFAAFGWATI